MTMHRLRAAVIALTSLLLLPLAALPPGAAAQDYTVWRLNLELRDCCSSGRAAHQFAMHARLELAVLADGTLAVRQASGTATFGQEDGDLDAHDYVVWGVGSARVSGFRSVTVDGGAAVPVLEEISLNLVRINDSPPKASDDFDRATVVVVVGPAEPPASDNGWYHTKSFIIISAGDTTLSSEGTLRYRLVAGGR